MRQVLEEAGMAEQAVEETEVEGGARAIALLWNQYETGEFGNLAANTGLWSSDVQIPRYVEIVEKQMGKIES